jgi:hypothetical protein
MNSVTRLTQTAAAQTETDGRTQAVMAAKTAFLNLLSADQCAKGWFPFASPGDGHRTYSAWYGSTANPSPVYFRISGPTLHIEFAHQQWDSQADGVNHIHTIFRDPTNDYGRGFTAKWNRLKQPQQATFSRADQKISCIHGNLIFHGYNH